MANAGAAAVAVRAPHRWWRSLAARATAAAAIMLATLALLLIAISASGVREQTGRGIEREAAARADELVARLEAGDLALNDVGQAATASGLAYAYVDSASGRPVSGTRPAAPAPAVSEQRLGETQRTDATLVVASEGVAHIAKAVTVAGEPMTLRVGKSLAAAEDAGTRTAMQGVAAALAFLALALPILAFAVDRVAAPLRALTRAVSTPGSSQAEMRAAGSRGDEVGALARAHLAIARNLAQNADALHRLTFDDPLTQLPNRASLTSRVAAALQIGQPLAVLKIEVQGLSRVAAGLGQQFGDEAVRRAGERLREMAIDWARDAESPIVRAADDAEPMLARISDTGFGLLLFGAESGAAQALATAALAAFEAPLFVGEHHVATTLAIGVALAPADGDDAGALLRSAAAAVSAARAAGPQSIRFAGAELNRMAYGRLRLEQDLRRAIDRGELELHYQPQIALSSRAVSGAEALVRWRHPIRGLVSPMEFVPLAEECGLIEPLGRFVLAQASRTAADWHARGLPLRIAVNVSAIQFGHQRFADRTLDIIGAAGADPSQIELEITESAAMGDPAHAARELAPLKSAGIRIAIDDFGTGYSNLSALTRLPFDVLKIDRAFVRDASGAIGARAVVAAVMGLARNLGFETVAEGVETEDQLEFVTEQGCTHVQGYLFGKPMPAPAFEAWYRQRMIDDLRALGERGADQPRPEPAWAASLSA
ncbi:GGDEF domain-containing phosphodiesterase [Methylopila sp. M107]|uniref:putative bifunctional diguanylate cyclase/phosphodiesterase n=1 Tax=Methylopila sp. M107 TaxID=1101190 RepID=UPI0003A58FA1|nr:GGDEF domain-containing phosphodiesterase [Methylopila sp. M107]